MTLQKIKEELTIKGLIDFNFAFEVYTGGMFVYVLIEPDDTYHEICIVNGSATFMGEELLYDLLTFDDTIFLQYRYYEYPDSNGEFQPNENKTMLFNDILKVHEELNKSQLN